MRRRLPLLVLAIVYGHTISAFTYLDISEKAREKSTYTTLTHVSVDDDVPLSLPTLLSSQSRNLSRRYCCLVLQANGRSDKEKDSDGKKGYRFGDITQSLIGGSVERVRDVYEMILLFDQTYHFSQRVYHCRSPASHTSLEVRMIQVSKRCLFSQLCSTSYSLAD